MCKKQLKNLWQGIVRENQITLAQTSYAKQCTQGELVEIQLIKNRQTFCKICGENFENLIDKKSRNFDRASIKEVKDFASNIKEQDKKSLINYDHVLIKKNLLACWFEEKNQTFEISKKKLSKS